MKINTFKKHSIFLNYEEGKILNEAAELLSEIQDTLEKQGTSLSMSDLFEIYVYADDDIIEFEVGGSALYSKK